MACTKATAHLGTYKKGIQIAKIIPKKTVSKPKVVRSTSTWCILYSIYFVIL